MNGLSFAVRMLTPEDIKGKRVLHIGAYDETGILRQRIEDMDPLKYLGLDSEAGPGVDKVIAPEHIVEKLGAARADVVICTEVLQEVEDWRVVMSNIATVLKPGGLLVLTVASTDDTVYLDHQVHKLLKAAGLSANHVEQDSDFEGIFLKAYKPKGQHHPVEAEAFAGVYFGAPREDEEDDEEEETMDTGRTKRPGARDRAAQSLLDPSKRPGAKRV